MTHPHPKIAGISKHVRRSLKGNLLIFLSFKWSRSDYHIMRRDQFCQTIWYSCSLGSHSFSDWERWTWLMVGSQQSAPYCGILWNTIWYRGTLWNTVEYYGSQQSAPSSEDLHPSSKNVPLVTSSTPLRHLGGTRRLLWRQIMPGSQMSGRIPFLRDLWPVLEKLTDLSLHGISSHCTGWHILKTKSFARPTCRLESTKLFHFHTPGAGCLCF